jgi:hypothetical protein
MFSIYETKKELTGYLIHNISIHLENSDINVSHQKLKECVAQVLGYKTFASLLSDLPIKVDMKKLSQDFSVHSNKTFADKIDHPEYFQKTFFDFLLKCLNVSYEICLRELRALDKPAIFWNKGWGDSDLFISVVNDDGDMGNPICYIPREVYKQLLDNNALGENILQTHKARKLRLFILDDK